MVEDGEERRQKIMVTIAGDWLAWQELHDELHRYALLPMGGVNWQRRTLGGGNSGTESVAVGEMAVEFAQDPATTAGAAGAEGKGEWQEGHHAEPLIWWRKPFVHIYVVSPTAPHDHRDLLSQHPQLRDWIAKMQTNELHFLVLYLPRLDASIRLSSLSTIVSSSSATRRSEKLLDKFRTELKLERPDCLLRCSLVSVGEEEVDSDKEEELVRFRAVLRELVLRACDARISGYRDAAPVSAAPQSASDLDWTLSGAAGASGHALMGVGKGVALQESVAMIWLALGAPMEALRTYTMTFNELCYKAAQVGDVSLGRAAGVSSSVGMCVDPRLWAPDNEGSDCQGVDISLHALSERQGELLLRGDVPLHRLQLMVLGRELALLQAMGHHRQAAFRAAQCVTAIVKGLLARGYSPGHSLGGSRGVSPLHALSLLINVSLQLAAQFPPPDVAQHEYVPDSPAPCASAHAWAKPLGAPVDMAEVELYVLARNGVAAIHAALQRFEMDCLLVPQQALPASGATRVPPSTSPILPPQVVAQSAKAEEDKDATKGAARAGSWGDGRPSRDSQDAGGLAAGYHSPSSPSSSVSADPTKFSQHDATRDVRTRDEGMRDSGGLRAKWTKKEVALAYVSRSLSHVPYLTSHAAHQVPQIPSPTAANRMSHMAEEAANRAAGVLGLSRAGARKEGAPLRATRPCSEQDGVDPSGVIDLGDAQASEIQDSTEHIGVEACMLPTLFLAGSRAFGLEKATREEFAEMADAQDARQRVTGRLALALATPDGILHLLHEMSAQCCREFRAANRPRSAVVLVLEAARTYVGEGSWDLAEGLLLDVYARVLNDAWPLLVQDVYDLLLRCYTERHMLLHAALMSLDVLSCNGILRECACSAAARLEDFLARLGHQLASPVITSPMHKLVSVEIQFPAGKGEEQEQDESKAEGRKGTAGQDESAPSDFLDTVLLDLGGGVILTSKRVTVDSLVCDGEEEDDVRAAGEPSCPAAPAGHEGKAWPSHQEGYVWKQAKQSGLDQHANGPQLAANGSCRDGQGECAVWKVEVGAMMEVRCVLTSRLPVALEDTQFILILRRNDAAEAGAAPSHVSPQEAAGLTARRCSASSQLELLAHCDGVEHPGRFSAAALGVQGGLTPRSRSVEPESDQDAPPERGSAADSGDVTLTASNVGLMPGRNHIMLRGQVSEAGDYVLHTLTLRAHHGRLHLLQPLTTLYSTCLVRVRSERAPVTLSLAPRGPVVRGGLGCLLQSRVTFLPQDFVSVSDCRVRLVLPPELRAGSSCVLYWLESDSKDNEGDGVERRHGDVPGQEDRVQCETLDSEMEENEEALLRRAAQRARCAGQGARLISCDNLNEAEDGWLSIWADDDISVASPDAARCSRDAAVWFLLDTQSGETQGTEQVQVAMVVECLCVDGRRLRSTCQVLVDIQAPFNVRSHVAMLQPDKAIVSMQLQWLAASVIAGPCGHSVHCPPGISMVRDPNDFTAPKCGAGYLKAGHCMALWFDLLVTAASDGTSGSDEEGDQDHSLVTNSDQVAVLPSQPAVLQAHADDDKEAQAHDVQVQVEYAVHEMDPIMSLLWSADGRRACQGTGANVFGVFAANVPVKSSQSHDFEIELFVGEEWQAVAEQVTEQMPGQGQRDGDDMLRCCVGESVSLVCRVKAIGCRLGHVTNSAAAALEYALDVPAGGGWLLAGRTRGSLVSTRDESKEWLTRCWMMPTLCGRLALPVLSLQGVAKERVWNKTEKKRVMVVETAA